MGIFNNRELATFLWLAVFLAFAFAHADVRRSFARVLQTFFCVTLQVLVWAMLFYSTAMVALLARFRLWNATLLKDTIIWFCVVAVSMLFRYGTSSDGSTMFRKVATDALTAAVVLEFLINTYTFSLPVELVIVPVVTVLSMAAAYGKLRTEYVAASRVAQWIVAGFVLIVLAHVIVGALSDLRRLGSMDTVRSIVLEPVLSVLLIPLLYAMSLRSKYEEVFIRLNLDKDKNPDVVRYARRRITTHAGLNLGKLQSLLRRQLPELMRIKTREDVDRLIVDARLRQSRGHGSSGGPRDTIGDS
jgi:hypothetical protein